MSAWEILICNLLRLVGFLRHSFDLDGLPSWLSASCIVVCIRRIERETLITSRYVLCLHRELVSVWAWFLSLTPNFRQDRYVRMRQIYETIDRQGYQWVVVLVAGLGFFLDGYTVRQIMALMALLSCKRLTCEG